MLIQAGTPIPARLNTPADQLDNELRTGVCLLKAPMGFDSLQFLQVKGGSRFFFR